MDGNDANSVPALGFVTILDNEQQGLSGGYLLINPSGRPLEFHCTAPIRASRAQQILYGPTLEPFLYGEQIAATLVKKASIRPMLLCTDQEPVLAVRSHVDLPVALVRSTGPQDESITPGLKLFRVGTGELQLAVPGGYEEDQAVITQALQGAGRFVDLAEPLERIREAIREAHRGRRAA